VCIYHPHDSARLQYITNGICYYYVQLDRLVKEFIVPLENQIKKEQEEKQAVEKEKETQKIVGQKRRARTIGKSSTSSASKEMVAAGGTRRSKRVKVAPAYYVPVAEEESVEASPHASSGVVTMNTTLTASPPLESSIAASDETTMNGSNEDTNIGSSRSMSAVAAATKVHKRRQGAKTFDERFKDLMAFKEEFGHCNVPQTQSRNNKHTSLGKWCSHVRQAYKAINEGGIPRRYKLSKADMKRLENAGFELNLCKKLTFDDRLKDLMAFKAKFGHCNVPQTQSNSNKLYSLGNWCSDMRRSYKTIKEGGMPRNYKLSKANMKRLENAGFEWNLCKTVPFDERFKDLMAFKAEFYHCNVHTTNSSNNKHYSLGQWFSHVRQAYKTIKEGGMPRNNKLSKADMRRLENAGFEWNLCKKIPSFYERFNDLKAFKAEFGHCNVPGTNSKNKNKYYSLGKWCSDIRRSYRAIQEGRGKLYCKSWF
jgi:hypothetical protein